MSGPAQPLPYLSRMRLVLALVLSLAAPAAAQAWEVTLGPICTLTHETPEASVVLTYDPSLPEYSITLTRKGAGWGTGPVFAMHFFGEQPNQIATDRHKLGEGGAALTVTDRGFGNVLDGLQFNNSAGAYLGDQAVTFDLEGAAPAVAAFRDCAAMPLA